MPEVLVRLQRRQEPAGSGNVQVVDQVAAGAFDDGNRPAAGQCGVVAQTTSAIVSAIR